MKKIIAAFIIFLIPMMVFPKEIGGKIMPDKLKVGETKLILNGAGIVTKYFIGIKVYAVGLYLVKKSQKFKQILKADKAMAIRMHFIYDDIEKEKIIDSWKEGFPKNISEKKLKALKSKIKKFISFFSKDNTEDDIYQFEYIPGTGTKVFINKKLKGTIKGLDFKYALFAIWLGKEDPRDDDVREEMLGID